MLFLDRKVLFLPMAPIHPRWFLLRALPAWALILSASAQAELVVVMSPSVKAVSLSREQVADVFLGRATFLPGIGSTVPLDQQESSPLREEFYLKIVGRTAAQAKSYWAKLAFTGKGRPPREVAGTNEIKRLVATTPGALAYIDRSAVDDSVKVVFSAP
jgi:ABC-type phosphate transport system substrate-binding protein